MNIAFLKRELTYYQKMMLPDNIVEKEYNYNQVKTREASVFKDSMSDCVDRFFLINIQDKYQILGFKIMVNYFRNQGEASIDMDSQITADMLLGVYKKMEVDNNIVTAVYYPLEQGEKKYAFNMIKQCMDAEVTYPIVLTQNPKDMPKWKEIWEERIKDKTKDELVEFLSNTEVHLRRYTEEVLRNNQKFNFTIYDPACSTGEFLEYVKEKFSGAYAIGHDMDENMVRIAETKVDESACCNASASSIAAKSIDILVLRFLNYAVVNRTEAEKLFKKLVTRVKDDGMIICFGHTPVLLDTTFFESFGLKIIKKIGYEQFTDSIFQYYVMKR